MGRCVVRGHTEITCVLLLLLLAVCGPFSALPGSKPAIIIRSCKAVTGRKWLKSFLCKWTLLILSSFVARWWRQTPADVCTPVTWHLHNLLRVVDFCCSHCHLCDDRQRCFYCGTRCGHRLARRVLVLKFALYPCATRLPFCLMATTHRLLSSLTMCKNFCPHFPHILRGSFCVHFNYWSHSITWYTSFWHCNYVHC